MLVMLLAAVTGCTRTPIEDSLIAADDTTTFYRWKRDTASQLSPEQQRQLETTLAELRLDIMFRQVATGHDAIESAVCERLNRLPVKEALLLGAQLKWHRLAAERDDLQRVINANSRLITKPGDQAAAADLDQYRAKQQQRADTVAQELQGVEKEIQALGGQIPALNLPAPATKPIAVSHAEATKQIADMLEGRRTAAVVRFGDWPVKIDWEGKQLEGDKRVEFLAKSAVNGRGERVVIPIRIKGSWLLFEASDQAPALPEDVRATLTTAELAAFKKDWIELEAELWARQLAKELPDAPPVPVEEKPDTQPVLLHK